MHDWEAGARLHDDDHVQRGHPRHRSSNDRNGGGGDVSAVNALFVSAYYSSLRRRQEHCHHARKRKAAPPWIPAGILIKRRVHASEEKWRATESFFRIGLGLVIIRVLRIVRVR